MKHALCLILTVVAYPFFTQAQSEKPPVDTGVFRKWPVVESPVISNNGQYISYTIYNQPVDNQTLITKLGLQGHSFAGYQTNYLITHTSLFAAASEAAGAGDLISSYGQLNGVGSVRQMGYEIGWQGCGLGIGKTPWSDPESYIDISPVFNIGKISTPLLMMHCRNDWAVPFEQAVELFTGMRRTGKKVWMLEYDNGGHSLGGKDAMDFTIRMRQFFDHYLKDSIAPKWMTKGIPARLKGIDMGYDIDREGSCGENCKNCINAQRK